MKTCLKESSFTLQNALGKLAPLQNVHKCAVNRQTEGSGLVKSAARLSGRQCHLNKLQKAYKYFAQTGKLASKHK